MISLDGYSLTINDLVCAARYTQEVEISAQAVESINKSKNRLDAIIAKSQPVYGLNTGFGIFADRTISREESQLLNRNLILSHAVGMGLPLPLEVVRTAMIIRANALSKGYSGIRLQLVETIVEMLNRGVTPEIYSKGSLGSSGDLCMLAQMALVLSKAPNEKEAESGRAYYRGNLMNGRVAMKMAGIERQILENKDGLALINGANFSAALLALSVYDSGYLTYLADLAAALSFEALLGRSDALHPGIHKARGLYGQIESAKSILGMMEGSNLIDSHKQIQDAYSLRCTPQVHGAVRDTLSFCNGIISREINAATDNPLIVEEGRAISGGNFHGEPVGLAADYLGISISELAAISERRIFRMLDSHLNQGLPVMLVGDADKAGLNSGIMMLQYTAAALVLENQTLATPDTVRSLPTSANQEDFNANSYNAAFHAWQIVENAVRVLAIEVYTACRAIDMRQMEKKNTKLGKTTGKAFDAVREIVPFQAGDAYWKEEIDLLCEHLYKKNEFRETFYCDHLTKQ